MASGGLRRLATVLATAWWLARPATAPGVSFTKEVAPILAGKCGGCHVSGRKGNFQMASYAALMQTGMVQQGNANASRLVEVILSGDMPRGGGKVSSAEVGTLMKWIDGGARYDAVDQTISLDVLARGGAAPPPVVPVPAAPVQLKPGEVSFAVDVAPVLLKQCAGCHDATEPGANLQMTSLEALLRGGRTGPSVLPGKGEESLLVRKLRGQKIDGQRMPLNKPPLAADVIATIERWIDEGVRLDMLAAKTPLETIVAAGRAKSLSDADLARIRFDAGKKLWRRAIPDEEPVVEAEGGLCLIGNLPPARMEELAAKAEPIEARVRDELVAGSAPLLRGGVVVYVFRQSYDYSALWQNVVGRERPKGIVGNAGVAGEVAYGAMLVPGSDDAEENTRLLLAEQIAAAAFAGRSMPDWFVRGAGRTVAVKLAPKASLAADWKRDAPAAVMRLGSSKDFFAGHSEPAAAAVASGGFVASIATGARLKQVVKAIDEGATFDDAFAKVFRGPPQQAFEAWAAKEVRRAPKASAGR
jgi:hypothetical protein